MNLAVLTLMTAALLAGGALGVFVTLLAGIRSEERNMRFHAEPSSRAGLATRRVLSLYVRSGITKDQDAGR